MNNYIPVTVIIPVKNEEINIKQCLRQLTNFSQIIVVDSNSTDNTREIVKSFNVDYISFNWNGYFPKKRNWTLRNADITNNWVLFLDADEYVTKDFINELSFKINSCEYSGYWLKYNNNFMHKELKYGDKMKKLALFKKGAGEYEKIYEETWSHLDMEVHEHPIITGKIGNFKSSIVHNDFKGLDHYIHKHNAYSTWEAHRYLSLKSNKGHLTLRQRVKYKLINTGLLSFLYFFSSYIIKLGFLDGIHGYYFAKYKAHYFFQIKTKIKELQLIN
ncbi:MAG: glycosyltransferase family 2 protein [Lewinellaceae bacterium]|nr:glycosyltransferase family 2 protein [Lewinellaceae bacterium]